MNAQVTGIYFIIFPICFTTSLLIHETPASSTRGPTSHVPSYTISSTSHPPPTIADYGDRIGDLQTSIEDPLSARIITRHHPRISKPRRRQPPQHQQQRPKPNTKDVYHDYRRQPMYYNLNQPDTTYNHYKKSERPTSMTSTPAPPVMIYRGPDRPLEPYMTRPPATKIQFKRRVKHYDPRTPNDILRRSSAQVDHEYHRLLRRSYSIDDRSGDIRLQNGSRVSKVVAKRRGLTSPEMEPPPSSSLSKPEVDPFQTGSDSNVTLQSTASTSFLNEYNSKSGAFADITRLKELQDDSDYQHAGESEVTGVDVNARPNNLNGKPNYDIHSGGIFESESTGNDSIVETENGTNSKLQHRSMNTRSRFDRYDTGIDYDYFVPNPVPLRSNRHGRKRNSGGGRSRDDDFYSGGSSGSYGSNPPGGGRRRNQNLERNRDSFRVMDHYDGGFSAPRSNSEDRIRSGGATSGRSKMAAPVPIKTRPVYGEEYDFEDYENVPRRSRSRPAEVSGGQRRRTNSGQEEVRRQRQYPQKIDLNYDVRPNRRANVENLKFVPVDMSSSDGSGSRRTSSRSNNQNYRNQNGGGDRIQNGGGDRIQNSGGDRMRNSGGDRAPIGYRIFRNAGAGGRTSSSLGRSTGNEGGRSYTKQLTDEPIRSRSARPANRSPNPSRQRPSYKDGSYSSYDSADYDYPTHTFRRSEPRRVVAPSVSYDDVD